MFKDDAVKYFGTNSRVAAAAGVDRSAVSQWKILVPERCAQRLSEASGGALNYNKEIYDQYRRDRRSGKKIKTAVVGASD